jgi:hypothetical protein
VLTNTAAHPLTGKLRLFGDRAIGSTGTLFLFGIVIGAVPLLGFRALGLPGTPLWATGPATTLGPRRARAAV